MKSNKGITLVALVITIIVLLILAGVSISLVVGDNGVLTQAKTSSDKTKISQFKEALGIAINDVQTAYFANYANNATTRFDTTGSGATEVKGEVTLETINAALEKQGYQIKDEADRTGNITTTPSKIEITTKSNPTDFLAVKVTRSSADGVGVTTVFAKEMNEEVTNSSNSADPTSSWEE